MITIVVAGMGKERVAQLLQEAGGGRIEAVVKTDLEAAIRGQDRQGRRTTSARARAARAARSASRTRSSAPPGGAAVGRRHDRRSRGRARRGRAGGKRAFGLTHSQIDAIVPVLAGALLGATPERRVPDEVAEARVIGALGAASAAAANRNIAIYHDGLRTSVDELESGERDAPTSPAYAYRISIGFVVAYALPFALASGILTIHMILLGTDVIGVRAARRPRRRRPALAWGARRRRRGRPVRRTASSACPSTTTGRDLLWLPLVYALPLLGVVVAAGAPRLPRGRRRGRGDAGRLGARARGAALRPTRARRPSFGSGLVALASSSSPSRSSPCASGPEEAPDLAFFEDNVRRARRGWPLLLPIAAPDRRHGVVRLDRRRAGAARAARLEPSRGRRRWSRSFSAIGFLPLQGMTGLVSGVWNQDGYPDWFLGAGYVDREPAARGRGGCRADGRRAPHAAARRAAR